MSRLRPPLLLALLLIQSLASGCRRSAPAADSPSEIHRVVCLAPSATEIVAAVGAAPLIVGVDEYSQFPPEVRHLPKLGDFLHPNLEAILALHPDIAFVDSTQTNLNLSGIRSFQIRVETISDIREALRSVGAVLGREADAGHAIEAFDRRLAEAEARARKAAQKAGHAPRVLFIVDRRPGALAGMIAAGPHSFIDELLTRAGAENVLRDAPTSYVKISPETVIDRAPDIILDAVHDPQATRARADWDALAAVPAVKNNRIEILGDEEFVVPGPRVVDALDRLIGLIWQDTP